MEFGHRQVSSDDTQIIQKARDVASLVSAVGEPRPPRMRKYVVDSFFSVSPLLTG